MFKEPVKISYKKVQRKKRKSEQITNRDLIFLIPNLTNKVQFRHFRSLIPKDHLQNQNHVIFIFYTNLFSTQNCDKLSRIS